MIIEFFVKTSISGNPLRGTKIIGIINTPNILRNYKTRQWCSPDSIIYYPITQAWV